MKVISREKLCIAIVMTHTSATFSDILFSHFRRLGLKKVIAACYKEQHVNLFDTGKIIMVFSLNTQEQNLLALTQTPPTSFTSRAMATFAVPKALPC